MIKLVACDLDGTLFNSNMTVSEANAQAVKNAQNNGIEFLIATGRAPRESRSILRDANLHTGFINLNGALVFNEAGQLMVKHSIPTQKAIQIVNLLHKAGFYFEVPNDVNGGLYNDEILASFGDKVFFRVAQNDKDNITLTDLRVFVNDNEA